MHSVAGVIRKCLNKSFVSLQAGQVPVRLKREIDGFALNRVQMAIIAESWRLVEVRTDWLDSTRASYVF